MLTDEEKARIIEEEQLRLEIRRQHYKKSGLRHFLLRTLLFLLIWCGFFWGPSIAVSVVCAVIGVPYPPSAFVIVLLVSLVIAVILIKKIK